MKILNSFIRVDPENRLIVCIGEWKVDNLSQLIHEVDTLTGIPPTGEMTISGKQLTHFDSSGAWVLDSLLTKLEKKHLKTRLIDFSEERLNLLKLVNEQLSEKPTIPHFKISNWLARVGKYTVQNIREAWNFLGFTGLLAIESLDIIRHPSRIRWNDFSGILEKAGYQALPIIAVLSFMVGIVLAHQTGVQLKNYGANIFIVNLLGFSALREFGPLITAIMVSGRTGSAFTAQIGIMKINQEIDALDTMGITSGELLILPRLAGLFVALPLLIVWADIWCILGGMMVSNHLFNITYQEFLYRFQHHVPVRYFLIGLLKAPIFALIIASIGCFQGVNVEGSADSLGKKTTRSVVLAIFFIIVADALFAILLSAFDL